MRSGWQGGRYNWECNKKRRPLPTAFAAPGHSALRKFAGGHFANVRAVVCHCELEGVITNDEERQSL